MASVVYPTFKDDYAMNDEDRIVLEEIIKQQKEQYSASMRPDKFFELFSAEQVLKSRGYDLDLDQIAAGNIGNGGDGGADSIYLLVNNKMVREDSNLAAYHDQQLTIDLVIIQSKREASFGEMALKNFTDFTDNCLRLSSDLSSLSRELYKQTLIDVVSRFRSVYLKSLSQRPTLKISFYYASLGEHVDKKVQARANALRSRLREFFSNAESEVELAGAKKLLKWFYISPSKTITIETVKHIPGPRPGKSYAALVSLTKFYEFITENGKPRERIFEANVRDYQGDVKVNEEIAKTLVGAAPEDFWWLNNGITVLASDIRGDGDFLTVTDALIVNGLQTSYEIYKYLKDSPPTADDARNILVRIIESNDPQSTDRIIKATNSQTKIPPIWLHSTEEIHRTIETVLKAKADLYYDRRKNYYRNRGVPPKKIVTIPYLSQALVAIVLRRPDDARARPTTAAERHYKALYADEYPKDMYSNCARIMKRVDEFVYGRELETGHKANIRFYLAMYSVCAALRSPRPRRQTIAAFDLNLLTDQHLDNSLTRVVRDYFELGGDDVIAKGTELNIRLQKDLQDRFGRKKDEAETA